MMYVKVLRKSQSPVSTQSTIIIKGSSRKVWTLQLVLKAYNSTLHQLWLWSYTEGWQQAPTEALSQNRCIQHIYSPCSKDHRSMLQADQKLTKVDTIIKRRCFITELGVTRVQPTCQTFPSNKNRLFSLSYETDKTVMKMTRRINSCWILDHPSSVPLATQGDSFLFTLLCPNLSSRVSISVDFLSFVTGITCPRYWFYGTLVCLVSARWKSPSGLSVLPLPVA